jgi:hypothetical protein
MRPEPNTNRITKTNIIGNPPNTNTRLNPDGTITQIAEIAYEELGYNAPFRTFTWTEWQQMRANIICALSRFQLAIEHHQLDIATAAVAEISLTLNFMQAEARNTSDKHGH